MVIAASGIIAPELGNGAEVTLKSLAAPVKSQVDKFQLLPAFLKVCRRPFPLLLLLVPWNKSDISLVFVPCWLSDDGLVRCLQVRGLVKQHIDSFNYFVNSDIKKILKANDLIVCPYEPSLYLRQCFNAPHRIKIKTFLKKFPYWFFFIFTDIPIFISTSPLWKLTLWGRNSHPISAASQIARKPKNYNLTVDLCDYNSVMPFMLTHFRCWPTLIIWCLSVSRLCK